MKQYNEIISKSLIDFEELKYILANNNIKLVGSSQVKEKYYLYKDISLKNSSYKKILENAYTLITVEDKHYLVYKTKNKEQVTESSMEVIDEQDCIDFLNHVGYVESYSIEKNIYIYSDGKDNLSVFNLVNVGDFLSVSSKENLSVDELKTKLKKFGIPFDEDECDVCIEKIIVGKKRRYM